MSLDVVMYESVRAYDALDAVKVSDNREFFKEYQGEGIIPVVSIRIGRNCMNSQWHTDYQKCLDSPFDNHEQMQENLKKMNELLYIKPLEIHDKLLSRLDEKEKHLFDIDKLEWMMRTKNPSVWWIQIIW